MRHPQNAGWVGAGLLIMIFLRLGVFVSPAAAQVPANDTCTNAIGTAQDRYGVPPGLLFAIGQVESGRRDPLTQRLVPWPWTVQAENRSYYFTSKAEAVAWVEAARARGVVSIDVGCMQVNLRYHPAAFQTLDDAFDPMRNADYAARFLVSLATTVGDWHKAAGLYHSQTLALAEPYARQVEAALTGRLPGSVSPKPTLLTMLQDAWGATLEKPPVEAPADWAAAPSPRLAQPPVRVVKRRRSVLLSYEH